MKADSVLHECQNALKLTECHFAQVLMLTKESSRLEHLQRFQSRPLGSVTKLCGY
jgi:hypothetical protein